MTIIPAPPGFRLIRTYAGDTGAHLGEDPFGASEIVIAFVINSAGPIGGATSPLPVTCTGTPNLDRPWLLAHPDGNFSMGGDGYGSFAAWKRDVGLGG